VAVLLRMRASAAFSFLIGPFRLRRRGYGLTAKFTRPSRDGAGLTASGFKPGEFVLISG